MRLYSIFLIEAYNYRLQMFQVKFKTARKSQLQNTPTETNSLDSIDGSRCCASNGVRNRAVRVGPIFEKKFKVLVLVDSTAPPSQKRTKVKRGGGIEGEGNLDHSPAGFARKQSFLTAPYNRIISICKAAFQLHEALNIGKNWKKESITIQEQQGENASDDKGQWKGVKSLLICAPEGAGKTFLLGEIEQSLRILGGNPDFNSTPEFVVLRLSAKNCGRQSLPPSASFQVPSLSTFGELKGRNVARSYLCQAVHNMTTADVSPDIEEKMRGEAPLRIVLLIDDLDILFLPFMRDDGEGDDQVDAGDKDTASARTAYSLRQLLSAITIPNHDYDQIIVIGATRFPPASLPRSHLGSV